MKVHRVELLIVDTDDIGDAEVQIVLENARYPNRCIAPHVMGIDTREVEWSDEHPLNRGETQQQAFDELFPPVVLFDGERELLTRFVAGVRDDLADEDERLVDGRMHKALAVLDKLLAKGEGR